jgi:hypothetical protein
MTVVTIFYETVLKMRTPFIVGFLEINGTLGHLNGTLSRVKERTLKIAMSCIPDKGVYRKENVGGQH